MSHTPHDVLPLPDTLKQDLREVLIATFGPRFDDQRFELLWQMIDSATWEYRQTAVINQLDVQATLSRASDLAHQAYTQLDLTPGQFDDIARAMINLNSCAGFFGLYFDRFMLTSSED